MTPLSHTLSILHRRSTRSGSTTEPCQRVGTIGRTLFLASLLWMVAELSGREQVAAATPCEQAKPCVDVNWIEVTQAIQDTNNLVPLIAGKRTLVRAYFIPAKGHGPVNLATGELFAKGPAGKTKTFLSMPSNVPATATGDGSPGTGLQSSRHDLAR